MKTPLFLRAFVLRMLPASLVIVLLGVGTQSADAIIRNWTNSLGGSWFVAGNWSPNGVPDSSDAVTITNSGTYTVLVSTGSVASAVLNLGGGTGTQTLIYGTSSGQLLVTNSAVHVNGLLVVT